MSCNLSNFAYRSKISYLHAKYQSFIMNIGKFLDFDTGTWYSIKYTAEYYTYL